MLHSMTAAAPKFDIARAIMLCADRDTVLFGAFKYDQVSRFECLDVKSFEGLASRSEEKKIRSNALDIQHCRGLDHGKEDYIN